MTLLKKIMKKGFTLVELLVVIAIIGILVAIVMPAISDAMFRGKMTKSVAEMSNLFKGITAKESESIYTTHIEIIPSYGDPTDPTTNHWKTSTDYFAYFVTNRQVISVEPKFFSAPGLIPAISWSEFSADNNGWCIVADTDERQYPDTAPLIFSKNLGQGEAFDKLDDSVDSVGDLEEPPSAIDGIPFKRRGFVYLCKGGSGFMLFKDDMKTKNFTNMFKVVDINDNLMTNIVIRP